MTVEDHIILKHIAKTASATEEELVDKWIRESLDNRKHYQRLLTVHYESNHLKTFTTFDVETEWNDFFNNKIVYHEPIENSLPHRKIFLFATAASLILISAFLFLINRDTSISVSASDKMMSFKLPDNSAVTLFPNSTINYSADYLTDKERKISLSGKARFNVTKNPKSPFLVESNLINTKVLGTIFTINAYNPDVPAVDVEQGTVSVIEKSKKTNVRILKKGDSVVFKEGGFQEIIGTPKKVVAKVAAPPVKKKIEKKKVQKKVAPAIAKPAPQPKAQAPAVKEVETPKLKLSAYPVNQALTFLTDKHDNFSKSRRAKMKDNDIVMLNLNISLDEILVQFKKLYVLELEEGKCEGCIKLKKISKK